MKMRRTNTQVSLGWLLYMTSYTGVFFCTFYSSTTFVSYWNVNTFWNLMRIYAVAAIGFKCIYVDKYKINKLILYFIIVILSMIVYYYSDRGTILDVVLLIIGTNGVSYEKILKLYLKEAFMFLIIAMTSSFTGIIVDYTTIRTLNGIQQGSNLRHSFGINYSTDFAAHVFFIYLTYQVLRAKKRKISILDWILTILIVVGLDYYCDARLSELSIIITCFLFFLFEKRQSLIKSAVIRWITLLAFPLSAVISILTTIMYTSSNASWVLIDNALFNKRLSIGHKVYEQYGAKLFGQFIQMQGLGYKVNGFDTSIGTTYLDSSYMQLLLLYGVLMTIFIIGVLIVFSGKVVAIHDKELCIVVIVLAISCIINQYLLNVAYNPFILVAGTFVFSSKIANSNLKIALGV